MTFEEFVRDRVDKGECAVGQHIHVHTTEDMFKCIAKYGISIGHLFIIMKIINAIIFTITSCTNFLLILRKLRSE